MLGRIPEEFLVPIEEGNLSEKVQADLREHGKAQIGPRSRCPCGSGKRFKSCCMK